MNKKIVISGWYGPGNIGDEAILQAMIDLFEDIYPGCSITALSFNPSYTKKTQNIYSVRQIPSSIKGWIRSILTLDIIKTIHAIENCDIFVMGGGGFLSDWDPKVPKSWLKQMKIAKFFKKKTMLYGIGAGPFLSKNGKTIAKYYIDKYVDSVMVRDKESYRQLKDVVGIEQDIKIEIDPVANMKVERYIDSEENDNTVSLIFTKYFHSNRFDDKQHYKWGLLFEAFSLQIQAVIDKGYIPKLVFFQKDIEEDLAKDFLDKYKEKIKIEFPTDYKQAVKTLNRSIAVISFRLHGNILAYAMKKPFLPIIYHHKTDGFLSHIKYPYKNLILEVGDGDNWHDSEIIPNDWYVKTSLFLEKIQENNLERVKI